MVQKGDNELYGNIKFYGFSIHFGSNGAKSHSRDYASFPFKDVSVSTSDRMVQKGFAVSHLWPSRSSVSVSTSDRMVQKGRDSSGGCGMITVVSVSTSDRMVQKGSGRFAPTNNQLPLSYHKNRLYAILEGRFIKIYHTFYPLIADISQTYFCFKKWGGLRRLKIAISLRNSYS